MKATNVRVHMGIDKARQQCPTFGVDNDCSSWNRTTNGLDSIAIDNNILTANDALTIKNTRVADRSNRRLILGHTSMDVVKRVLLHGRQQLAVLWPPSTPLQEDHFSGRTRSGDCLSDCLIGQVPFIAALGLFQPVVNER